MVSSRLWLMPPLPQRVNSIATSVIFAIAIASWPAPEGRSKRGRPARSTAAPSWSISHGAHGAAAADTTCFDARLDLAPRADRRDPVQDVLHRRQPHRVVGRADIERQLAVRPESR